MHKIDNSQLIKELYFINSKKANNNEIKLLYMLSNKKFKILNNDLIDNFKKLTNLINDIGSDESHSQEEKNSLLQSLLSVYEYSYETLELYKPVYSEQNDWLNENEQPFSQESINKLKLIYENAQYIIQQKIDSIDLLSEYSIINK